jgi:hypothetical protein
MRNVSLRRRLSRGSDVGGYPGPMRSLVLPAILCASFVALPARADAPDPAVAVALGAATLLAGFVVGGTLTAMSPGSAGRTEAGWFAIESGFSMAPLLSHGLVEEWARGAVLAAIPTATTLATVPVFLTNDASVEHGTLPQQRVMWGLFCAGFAAALAGVIDTVFAPGRSVHLAPVLGAGQAGLMMGGAL